MNKQRVEFEKFYYGFPVILVSYYDAEGKPNLATMSSSWSLGNCICLGFGAGGHAIRTIRESGQLVVNVPDRTQMRELEICGYTSGAEHDKFALSGLTPVPSDAVNAPLVEECPISLECMVRELYEQAGYVIVVAEVVGRQVAQELLDEHGHLRSEQVDPVWFLGDGQERVYRYAERNVGNRKGFFLPERDDVVWR